MKIQVRNLVMDLFEVGKDYKIIIKDEDNGLVEYTCTVKGKDEYTLFIYVSETDGEWDEGTTYISWKIIESVEAL